MKNILVTGSTGFIGANLVSALSNDDGFRVSTLERLPIHSEFGALHPISSWGSFDDVCKSLVGIDVIVHLGGVVHRPDCRWDDYFRANVLDTKFLAEAALDAGVSRFIFLSSVSVFGDSTDVLFNETSPTSPIGWYGYSKLLAENALLEFSSSESLEVVIIRPPMVYGKGAPGSFRALSKYIERFHLLPVSGHPNSRSFISIDNLVSFILLVTTHPAAAGEVFLVSDGYNLSTEEFGVLVARAKRIRLFLVPIPVGILYKIAGVLGKRRYVDKLFGSFVLDISKSRSVLGWRPPLSVSEALERCFD